MVYEITGLSHDEVPPDDDLSYENPELAKSDLAYLRKKFPGRDFGILRDGVKITDAELDAEINSSDIQAVIEESTRLPGTYRPGKGTERDDVAIGPDGHPTKVWGPKNPDDRYE
jgi:hypothetical protein